MNTAAPASDQHSLATVPPWSSGDGIRAAWRGLGPACAVVFQKQSWIAAGLAALLAAILAWACGWVMPLPESPRSAEAAWVSVFLVNLMLLCSAVGWPALRPAPGWGYLQSWLRVSLLGLGAHGGLWLASWLGFERSGGVLTVKIVLLLALWFSAQAALITGLCALAAWSAKPWPWLAGLKRMGIALLLALAMSAFFWSKPILLQMYKSEQPARGAQLSESLMALNPLTSTAAVLLGGSESSGGPDLTKGLLAYEIWIGSYQPVVYPKLWPGKAYSGRWAPGLALYFFMTGGLLIILSDVAAYLSGPPKKDPLL